MVGTPAFCDLFFPTLGAILVGSSGVFPVLIVKSPGRLNLNEKALNRWLCFATGSLLGEVFLHLLPESVEQLSIDGQAWMFCLLFGIFFFYVAECLVAFYESMQLSDIRVSCNNVSQGKKAFEKSVPRAVGYLNLLANSIDNFSHGLSLGAGFSVSLRCGLVATGCLLIHEIPHEVSDFIILLRSGFTRWEAIKGQLLTASTCLVGTYAFLLDFLGVEDTNYQNIFL
ncbi:hypothetical protein Aperf_G00000064880 [Anoplocephala perfoliata]